MAQANVVAKVALVVGQAYAKSSDGSMRKLAVGDVIREGEQIVTSQGGRVELAFDDGTIRLARVNEPVHPDSFATAPNDGDQRPAELAGGDSQRVIDALAQGRNLDDLLEDPAAGLRTGGGRSDGGHAFVRLDRIVEPVTPLSFEFGTFERAAEFPVGGLATTLLVDRNSAPDAIPDTNAVTERVDSAVPSTTSGNVLTTAPHGAGFTDQADSDPEGDALTVTQAQFGTGPAVVAGTPMTLAYGTLTLDSDGTYTYSVDNANPTVNALNVGGILTEVVTYTVSDGNGGTATTTLTITINGANDSPTAIVGAPIVIPEDSPGVVVPLRGTDPDSPLQSVTVTALPPASQGALLKPDGTPVVPGEPIPVGSDGAAQLTFVPAPNFNGSVNVPFIVTDDQGAPSPGAVQQITVTPVNDAPVANNDSASTPNGQPVTINVLGNDSDPDGDPLAIVGTPTAPNGTVTVNPDGTLTYRPNPGFSGTETFTYTVTDPGGATSTATVTVNVAPPVNLPPVAQPDSATTSANTPVSGNVLTNDSDPENNPLTVTGFAVDTDGDGVRESFAPGQTATIAGVGTLAIGSTGAFTFSPAPDYSGPVPVANYSVTDGSGSASSTLTLGISAVPLPPQVGNVSSPTVTEGGNLDFVVTIANPSASPTTVTLALTGGTATLGTDTDPPQVSFDGGVTFAPLTTPDVTLPAGATSLIVRVPTAADAINEPTETLTLSASTPANTVPVVGTGSILDNSGQPTLSIDDVTVNEGAGTATFTVTLSAASGQTVTVGYNTSNGTATEGADYTAATGTLSFAPGETSKSITVPILNDATYEGAETFNVNLVAPVNAGILDDVGLSTIVDDGTGFVPPGVTPDDDRPAVASVSSPTVTEGAPLDFTVSLTHPSTTPTAVTLSPASGTATLGTDTDPAQVSFDGGASFVPVVGSTVTVPAGVTDFIVRFPTVDDAISEPAETMTLGAATAQNASPVSGTGTINDNDGAPQLSISGPADVNEAAGTISYTVSLTNASASPVTVNYATADGTATAGADYTASTGT
ncbi:MAG: retention module-containing protein [Sterolibacteriaceae bacterium]|nr:retention module-containing protein [Sterolibacteriaceae bacterium]